MPDGGRYWDRATTNPHVMVDYDFPDSSKNLYQSGCFWIVRKDVYTKHQWDSSIEFYAEKNGGVNEDIEYSSRLIRAGYKIAFDKNNLVWHNDDSYIQMGNVCVKKDLVREKMGSVPNTKISEDFLSLLDNLR